MTPETAHGAQILLVDDNPTNLQVLYQTLEGKGYRLLAARSGKGAISIAQRTQPDLILLDVMMPEMDGFETCALLKADSRTRDCPIIFLSALTEPSDKVKGLDLGAVDFVNKPFQTEEVLARVRTHLTIRDLQKQLRRRNEQLEHELTVAQELLRDARDRIDGVLLGESAHAVQLRRAIQDAAKSDDALLISGPPGSDHEAVARAVHHQSRRGARAIICVNCLALSPDTAAASAETGGALDLASRLLLADGGTLYLEGIQHLAPRTQQALVERLAARVESRRAASGTEPDVRVILSTTRDVDEEVRAGRLLPELHRLVRATLDIAPLRTRQDDLATLAQHILQRQAEQAGRTCPVISAESLARMKGYRWPGNIRELRHVLGCALAASQGPVLEIGDNLLDNGVRIGSYSLIERLGSGGMGEVWLARHQMLARPAAVKLVREAVGLGEDAAALRQRFAREAQATADLQSPHTVQLFDFGMTETGSFYYVMERLRGMDLQRMVERHGRQPTERVIHFLLQACLSLSEAHAIGLVHRDIKPANLFVCRLGAQFDFVKVLDFGVVSRPGDTAAPLTVAGLVMGTPAFLAPELGQGQASFDQRADIYSLGCVAFWLLTGHPPFDAGDAMALLAQHSTAPPRPPSTVVDASIPPEMDALVLECLSKDPALRPPTADVLRDRLAAIPVAEAWDAGRARAWWEQHEPQLIARTV